MTEAFCLYYLECLNCQRRWASEARDAPCHRPGCEGPVRPYGLQTSTMPVDDTDAYPVSRSA